MRKKVVSASEAVAILRDGDTLCCSGFGSNGVPVELVLALEKRFVETGSPKELTLLFGGGPGDGVEGGVNHLAHEGMLKRVIGGHYFEILISNSNATHADQYVTSTYMGSPLQRSDLHLGFNIERRF